MLNLFAAYYTDENLENNGTWKDIPGGGRLLVAREGNSKYMKVLGEQAELHQGNLDHKEGDSPERTAEVDALNKKVMAEVFAQSILLGWENISFDGKTLTPFTYENAKKALSMKEFLRVVGAISSDVGNFRGELEKAQTKN